MEFPSDNTIFKKPVLDAQPKDLRSLFSYPFKDIIEMLIHFRRDMFDKLFDIVSEKRQMIDIRVAILSLICFVFFYKFLIAVQ